MKISKAKAKDLINASKGKFFSVAFTKKNGELREMNCRKGVKKHLNQNKSNLDDSVYNSIKTKYFKNKLSNLKNIIRELKK